MAALDLSEHLILIVDDESFAREILRRILFGMNQPRLVDATNGAEAIDILRSSPDVSFVIADFNIPELNGLQLLKAVRSGDAGVDRAMPFAMLTGYSDKHLVDMALALDVNAFLIKPVSEGSLSAQVARMLTRGDDEPWIKPAAYYDGVGIVEAEAEAASAPVAPEDRVQAYRAMRRETEPEAEPEAEPGATELDPGQVGKTARVVKRLSSLRGKFDESALARNITKGVDELVSDTGDKTASRIVSFLDSLVTRKILELEDLPAVLPL